MANNRPGGDNVGQMNAQLLILVDDLAAQGNLATEHGLAVHIRTPGKSVLFDTGATEGPLIENAEILGVDLSRLDAAVISHGHYDHTGGLAAVLRIRSGLPVYAHPAAFSRRWANHPGRPMQDISCPHSVEALSQARASFQFVKAPQMLEDWLVLSGPIGGPRSGAQVFAVRRSDDIVVDGFGDEIFALIRGKVGWAVLTGCCHRGLRNTLRAAKFLAHDGKITAVIGGLHLGSASEDELTEAVELIEQAGTPDLYLCHCTGERAVNYLAEALPDRVHPVAAGDKVLL